MFSETMSSVCDLRQTNACIHFFFEMPISDQSNAVSGTKLKNRTNKSLFKIVRKSEITLNTEKFKKKIILNHKNKFFFQILKGLFGASNIGYINLVRLG